MKSNEITDADVDQSLQLTADIIDKFGPRLAGDPSTKATGDYLYNEFEKIYSKVSMDEFEVHPKAFLGLIRLLVFIFTIGIVSFWFQMPSIAAFLTTVNILIFILEFIFYYEILDPFWKRKACYNVYATIEPELDVQRQIILSGHHDSAFVFNFLVWQPKLYIIRMLSAIGFILLQFLIAWIWVLINLFKGGEINKDLVLGFQIILTIGLPFVVQMWFFRGSKGTPGAGDNLISTAVAHQIGKKLVQSQTNGNALKHTRVIIASWDAEEAGLRGSRDYCKRYKSDLLSIPTQVLNLESLYNVRDITFLTSDVNTTISLSNSLAKKCQQIAESLGYETATLPIKILYGGTDAGEFGRIGVKATTMGAMPLISSGRKSVYHTPNDTVHALNKETVRAALEIVLKFVQGADSEI